MGTSSSSNGPGSGIPMVPPWADSPSEAPDDGQGAQDDNQSNPEDNNAGDNTKESTPPPLNAPPGRFGGARGSLGAFAGDGSSSSMRNGIRQYVSRGYGGAKSAARRMGSTASTAGGLAGILSSDTRTTTQSDHFNALSFQSKNSDDVVNAIIEAVRPIDGTQDSEASRESIKDALSELLDKNPDADLLELNDNDKYLVIETFLATDIYQRIALDVGKHIQDKAPNAAAGVSRLKQIKEYVRETVKSSFNKIGNNLSSLSQNQVTLLARSVLEDTYEVFEDYTR